jgi:CBS domain-containing protein
MAKARDMMTTHLITVRPETSVYEAMQLLVQHRVTGLPVVENDQLLGIVTEKDLLETAYSDVDAGMGCCLDIMTTDLMCFEEEDEVVDIVEAMIQGHFRRVPIMRGDTMVGLVSRRDIIRYTLESQAAALGTARD